MVESSKITDGLNCTNTLFKKGDPTCDNCDGISILSPLTRLFY